MPRKEKRVSTDFRLYALDDEQVPKAKAYAATSLGYGNTNMIAVINAATMTPFQERMAIFFDYTHDTLYLGEHSMCEWPLERCSQHALLEAIPYVHDYPIIDDDLTKTVVDNTPDVYQGRAQEWLTKAAGRHLWYVFE